MEHILALDWGKKHIGLASSDPDGVAISPREDHKRSKEARHWQLHPSDIQWLQSKISQHNADRLVLGLPINVDGSENQASQAMRTLALQLEKNFKITVLLSDERYTSQMLDEKSKLIHAQSAAKILQNYFSVLQKTKSGFALLKIVFLIFLLGCAGIAYQYYNFAIKENNFAQRESIVIDVSQGKNYHHIVKELSSYGIKIPRIPFKLWARLMPASNKLQIGEYEFTKDELQKVSYQKLLESFSSKKSKQYKITIVEGANIWDVQKALKDHKPNLSLKEIQRKLRNKDLMNDLEIPHPDKIDRSLEGYLFPESYLFQKYDSIDKVIATMTEQFKKRALPLLKKHPWGKTAKGRHDLLTLASVVEKETGQVDEQPLIASVFWNRIKIKMRLQSDPTTIYGLLPDFDGNLKRIHLRTHSPWNTYKIRSLPASPICNPGLTAIQAVIEPDESKYIYFVSKNNGYHVFSKTLKEHNHNVDVYQRRRRRKK